MTISFIFPPDDNDPFLTPHEVAARIEAHFENANLDWESGNALVQESLEDLLARNLPRMVIESHKTLFNRTLVIKIPLPNDSGGIELVTEIDSALEIHASTPRNKEQERALVRELAKILGYDVFWTDTNELENLVH